MFKNLILPIQTWLLSQGRCVGCGMPLSQGKSDKNGLVTCKCNRVYKKDGDSYRRARLDEVK